MRLGLNWKPVGTVAELEAALPLIDELGLGAIGAPGEISQWSLAECELYGEMVRKRGLVIGEIGYWQNLLVEDESLRARRIEEVRSLLQKADVMGAGCVVTLVGSFDPELALAPHPHNWSERARQRALENCRRILDGLALSHTRYALEPWCNSFYHQAQEVSAFLNAVNHPAIALHMDVMNMHSVETYYHSTQVIQEVFDLLADRAVSLHAKDLYWQPTYMFMKLDEVMPGDGILDYTLFMKRLNDLHPDMPVYTEHWQHEAQYIEAIRRLRRLAEAVGAEIVGRGQ